MSVKLLNFLKLYRTERPVVDASRISLTRNNAVVTSTQLIYYYFSKYTGSRARSLIMNLLHVQALVWRCLEVGAEREAR